MKKSFKTVTVHTIALVIFGVMPNIANALLLTTSPTTFNSTASLTDVEDHTFPLFDEHGDLIGYTPQDPTSDFVYVGTSHISTFNSSMGVLMGATLNINSTRTQSIDISADGFSIFGTAEATGQSKVFMNVAGLGIAAVSSPISINGTCQAYFTGCSSTTHGPHVATNSNVYFDALNNFVRSYSSQFPIQRYIGLESFLVDGVSSNWDSATYTSDWWGNLSASYDYLLHAAPSLSTLTVDFGTVDQFEHTEQMISISNQGLDRTGLDLDSFNIYGTYANFYTDLHPFSGLRGVMGSRDFHVGMNTSYVGDFKGNLLLNFSDEDLGASSSWSSYALMVNLKGKVQRIPTAEVPEPATIALFIAALFNLMGVRRRKS